MFESLRKIKVGVTFILSEYISSRLMDTPQIIQFIVERWGNKFFNKKETLKLHFPTKMEKIYFVKMVLFT